MSGQKRQQWIRVCFMFGGVWLLLAVAYGLVLLILSAASFAMALLPVGMSDTPVASDQVDLNKRPWDER